jgi:hypothetical protein
MRLFVAWRSKAIRFQTTCGHSAPVGRSLESGLEIIWADSRKRAQRTQKRLSQPCRLSHNRLLFLIQVSSARRLDPGPYNSQLPLNRVSFAFPALFCGYSHAPYDAVPRCNRSGLRLTPAAGRLILTDQSTL